MADLRLWATEVADIRAIAVVGSYARGACRPGSDLDLVLLCERPDRFGPWLAEVPPLAPARFLHRRAWGPMTELRLRRRSGLHLDVGVAPLTWATVEPLDLGTARVLRDGVRIVHDPDRLLAEAAKAAGTTPNASYGEWLPDKFTAPGPNVCAPDNAARTAPPTAQGQRRVVSGQSPSGNGRLLE